MKYKIVWAHDSSQLELEVNRMMLEGWQPIGGLAAMSQSYGIDTFKGVLGGLEGTIDESVRISV
jgi:hypothetical protein